MGAIHYYEKERVFKLDTPHTSYLIGIVDEEGFLGHMYYGAKITDYDVRALMRTGEAPFVPSQNNRDRSSFLDVFPMECDLRIGQKRQYGGAAPLQGT